MPPFWNFDRREDRPELMDAGNISPGVMRETLGFLAMTNRFFGGDAVVLRRLEDWSRRWRPDETISLLDAGTGGADIALAAARWARRRKFRLRITAVDLARDVADIARENTRDFPEITVLTGDALTAPGGPWDYVTASLFLHHVPPPAAVNALRRLDHLARRGLVVSDLRRGAAGHAAVWALSRLAGNAVVRHDGPLSVRRAFTLEELKGLAGEARLPYLKARREPWFRVSLSGEKA